MSELEELRDEIEEMRSQLSLIDERKLRWLNEIDPLMMRVGSVEARMDRIEEALKKAGISV